MIAVWIAAAVAVAGGVVPVERLDGGLVVVPVGAGMTFVLDTGAGVTVLSSEAAEALGVRARRRMWAEAAGGRIPVDVGTCPELTVGGLELQDVRVAVLDLPAELERLLGRRIDGILGRSFLERADVELDLANATLTLHPPRTLARRPTPDGFVRQRFRLTGGAMRVPVRVGDAGWVDAVLDLGGEVSLVNQSMAEAAGVTFGRSLGHPAIVGADGTPVPLLGTVTVDRVWMGDLALGDVAFDVCGDEACRSLLDGPSYDEPGVHLGIDLLDRRTLHLSYAARTLFVSR